MSRKLFVVALDACDKDLVTAWAAEGHLPTFGRLMRSAISSDVQNARSLEAGSALPSFYYGSWPGAHGQYDGHRVFDPQSYGFGHYDAHELQREPLWNILANAGKHVFLVDAPYIPVPNHPRVTAIMNWCAHTPTPGESRISVLTNPPDLAAEVTEAFGTDPLGGFMCDHYRPRKPSEMLWFKDSLISRVRMRKELIKHYSENADWDLFLSVFSECHCIGHHSWHLHDPEHVDHDPELRQEIGDPILSVYKAVDEALGELVAQWEGRADILIYLTHGMEQGYSGTRLLDRILVRLERGGSDIEGLALRQAVRSAGVKVWRNSPKSVKRVLNPLRKISREQYYHDGFQPDRAKRRFFEIYANDRSAGLRINLAGREKHGIVKPGEEYESLCAQLMSDLGEIVNAETGEPVVAELTKVQDLFPGERTERLPDITVTWNRQYPIREVYSPKIGRVAHQHPNIRSGDHRPYGMFFYVGKSKRSGRLNVGRNSIDLTRTMAEMLGVENLAFEGSVISELLDRPDSDTTGSNPVVAHTEKFT